MTEPRKEPGPGQRRAEKSDLRGRAEAQAAGDGENHGSAPGDGSQVSHELRVHQIELEMQNEELRRAQEDLEASRARYFDLYDLAPVGFCTLDEAGIVQEANLTASRMFGVTRGELVGKPFTDFIVPGSQDSFYQHRRQLHDPLATHAFELVLRRNPHTGFWAWVEIHEARMAQGVIACRLAFTDITLLRQPPRGGADLEG